MCDIKCEKLNFEENTTYCFVAALRVQPRNQQRQKLERMMQGHLKLLGCLSLLKKI